MLLEYDVSVVGLKNVDRALASLERRFVQHNTRVARSLGASPTERASAGRAATPARQYDAHLRARTAQIVKEHLRAERAAVQAIKAREREADKAHRSELRRAERESRIRDRAEKARARTEARRVEATVRERTRFVRSTVGDSFGRVSGVARAVGGTGAALAGIGGAALAASSVSQASRLDELSRRLSIQGRDRGEAGIDPDMLRRRFTEIGIRRGLNPEAVGAGVAEYAAITGDVSGANGALAKSDVIATTAQATGADVTDVARISAHLTKLGITSIKDVGDALAKLAFQGKKGSFELKNMASELPEVLSSMASYGFKGQSDLATIGGMMQVAQKATGNASESTTAVQNAMRQIIAKSPELQSGEMFGGRKVQVFEGGDPTKPLRGLRDIFGDMIAASQGDIVKLNDLLEIRGSKAFMPQTAAFRSTREAALKRGASEKEATAEGRTAAMNVLATASDVDSNYAELQRDSVDAMKAFSVQMEIVTAKLKDAVASELFPEVIKLAPEIAKLIPYVTQLTRGLISITQWLANNPFTGIGLAIATSIAYDIAKARIGSVVTGIVQRAVAAGGGLGGKVIPKTGGTTVGAAGGAALTGAALGFAVGTAIFTAGVANFENAEVNMREGGKALNRIREAGSLDDLPQMQRDLEALEERRREVNKPGFFESIGLLSVGRMLDIGDTQAIERNTINAQYEEARARVRALEDIKAGGEAMVKAGRSQEDAARAMQEAVKTLATLGGPNRGNSPTQPKLTPG